MLTINPYLTFNGNCEEAFNFYKSVFGGDFPDITRFKDMPSETPIPDSLKEKVMHVSLPISAETVLMGCDANEIFSQKAIAGDIISLSVNTSSEDEATRIFSELSAGGTVIMPLEKSFWGALFGMFVDKFGIHWMVSYEYPQNQ